MPNVTVSIRNLDTNTQRSVQTTETDYYVFPELPIGNYEVSVEATSFKHYVATYLKLLVDLTLRVDIRLEVGNVTQEVDVTGQGAGDCHRPILFGRSDAEQGSGSVPLKWTKFY
jgi:hypothetical protein